MEQNETAELRRIYRDLETEKHAYSVARWEANVAQLAAMDAAFRRNSNESDPHRTANRW